MTATVNDFKDGMTFTGGASTDNASLIFTLLGGRYGVAANATWGGGSLTLRGLMPDGSTYVDTVPAFTADGTKIVDVPPGTYKFVIATATAVQAVIARIPIRPS